MKAVLKSAMGMSSEACFWNQVGAKGYSPEILGPSTHLSSLLYLLLLLFSHWVVSDSLWPHGLKHTRLPCPSLSPKVCSNSCRLSRWCHPTISCFVAPFSCCPQSFPASGSFLMSQFFPSGGQSIGASASASVLPMNIQDLFALGWAGWISLLPKGLSGVFSSTRVWKHQFFGAQPSLWLLSCFI